MQRARLPRVCFGQREPMPVVRAGHGGWVERLLHDCRLVLRDQVCAVRVEQQLGVPDVPYGVRADGCGGLRAAARKRCSWRGVAGDCCCGVRERHTVWLARGK